MCHDFATSTNSGWEFLRWCSIRLLCTDTWQALQNTCQACVETGDKRRNSASDTVSAHFPLRLCFANACEDECRETHFSQMYAICAKKIRSGDKTEGLRADACKMRDKSVMHRSLPENLVNKQTPRNRHKLMKKDTVTSELDTRNWARERFLDTQLLARERFGHPTVGARARFGRTVRCLPQEPTF